GAQKGGVMTHSKSIKAVQSFPKSSAGARDVLARATMVHERIYGAKEDYPNPPVDQAALKVQIDALSAGIAASLYGGKKAIAEREHQTGIVKKSLRQLAHYVEAHTKMTYRR